MNIIVINEFLFFELSRNIFKNNKTYIFVIHWTFHSSIVIKTEKRDLNITYNISERGVNEEDV